MPKCSACALIPELLYDVGVCVDMYVSHEPARILVVGDDEVPGLTGILSMRVPECHGLTYGITEDDDLIIPMERFIQRELMTRSGVSSHTLFRDVFPDCPSMMHMMGHSCVSLLFSSQRID
jgi:hypothetical protein